MNKLKIVFKVIEFSLYAIALAISIILSFYFKGNEYALYSVVYTLIALGLLEVVLLLVRVTNKDIIKSLIPYTHVAYMVTSILCYYVLKYATHYEEFKILYWSLYLGITLIAVIVAIILNYKLKKNKVK